MRILLKGFRFILLVTLISVVAQSAMALERAGRIERVDLEDGIIAINGTTYSVSGETLRVNWKDRALDPYLLEAGLNVIFTLEGYEDGTIRPVSEIKVIGPDAKVKEFFNH
jgi:hypothetical protein